MFDTIAGLPVHALVVHGVVVLLPLMSLVTVVWAFVPSAPASRGRVCRGGGERRDDRHDVRGLLQRGPHRRLGGNVAVEHAQIATLLPFFALSVLFASILVQGLRSGASACRCGSPAS